MVEEKRGSLKMSTSVTIKVANFSALPFLYDLAWLQPYEPGLATADPGIQQTTPCPATVSNPALPGLSACPPDSSDSGESCRACRPQPRSRIPAPQCSCHCKAGAKLKSLSLFLAKSTKCDA